MSKLSSAAGKRAALTSLLCLFLLLLAGRGAANPIIEQVIPTLGAAPDGITLGPDGAYWFVEALTGKIGRITPGGVITEFFIPSGYTSEPIEIVTGPDSNLWFTEYGVQRLGRITTNGTVTEFNLPAGIFPDGITLGPDNRLWVTDFGGEIPPTGAPTNGGIFAVTIATNGIAGLSYYNSNFTVGSRAQNIINGPDGRLYFTEQNAGKIGAITTNGVINESPFLATNCQPFGIVTGPDNALWFTEANSNKLGRVDTTLTNILEYLMPTNVSGLTTNEPFGLLVGPDGNFWYTDQAASCITRARFSGTNFLDGTEFFTPTTNSFPRRLATGPDGNIWFGEFVGNYPAYFCNIGEFIMPVPLSIQLITNSQVVLSWTTNITTNFVLQTNSDLNTTNWGFATNVPAAVGGRYLVTNPATGNLFYRLID